VALFGEREEQQAADRTQLSGHRRLVERLRRAVLSTNLGGSSVWPLHKRATYCMRLVGGGGTVLMDSPQSIRRAVIVLENYRGRSGL